MCGIASFAWVAAFPARTCLRAFTTLSAGVGFVAHDCAKVETDKESLEIWIVQRCNPTTAFGLERGARIELVCLRWQRSISASLLHPAVLR